MYNVYVQKYYAGMFPYIEDGKCGDIEYVLRTDFPNYIDIANDNDIFINNAEDVNSYAHMNIFRSIDNIPNCFKMQPHSKFRQYAELLKMGIHTPTTILGGTREVRCLYKSIDKNKRYIFKPCWSARSVGISRPLDHKEFYRFCRDLCNDKYYEDDNWLKFEELYHTKNVHRVTEDTYEFSILAKKESDYVIQEHIENVHKEFRILVFNIKDTADDMDKYSMWYLRDNTSLERDVRFKSRELSYGDIRHYKNVCEFIPTLRKMVLLQRVPWLAFDVYVTKDNQIGVFEYSIEFGTSAVDNIEKFSKLLNKSFKQWLVRNIKSRMLK